MATKVTARVRMYRLHELGDCFLVTFTADSQQSHMLIDCGSFRNGAPSVKRLRQITGDVARELNGAPLDVVVGTHQHNDHVNGFLHCETEFRNIGVEQVWLSWLDNPRDRTARRFGDEHNNLRAQVASVRDRLHARNGADHPQRAARSAKVLNEVLGFYGASAAGEPPELPAHAVKVLKQLGRKQPAYLKPGRTLDMPGLPKDTVRVHVLGPPREDDLLYRKDPRTGESYDHNLAAASRLAARMLDAVIDTADNDPGEEHYPFNRRDKRRGTRGRSPALKNLVARYERPRDAWRNIDDDWLEQAESLALYLDTYTNNSSLVLAVELVASGKVLLFVADAQTGNWLSWDRVKWTNDGVRTDDLLARTVFYKVGHHASHNATLPAIFEKLTHEQLTAFIPVHKKDGNIKKKNGWKMPARNLLKEIIKRTDNRVLQMDGVNPATCNPTRDPARAAWQRAGVKPVVTPLYIEATFE